MRDVELAWMAGIFDGEGCISIGHVSPNVRNDLKNPSYRLTVKVTMGHEPTIRRVAEIVGVGTVHRHQARSIAANESWSWVAMARNAEMAIVLLRPWLLTKADEADVALEFMRLPDVKRGGKGGSQPIDRGLLERKHELYLRCAQLKPRNRFRKTPARSTCDA